MDSNECGSDRIRIHITTFRSVDPDPEVKSKALKLLKSDLRNKLKEDIIADILMMV